MGVSAGMLGMLSEIRQQARPQHAQVCERLTVGSRVLESMEAICCLFDNNALLLFLISI